MFTWKSIWPNLRDLICDSLEFINSVWSVQTSYLWFSVYKLKCSTCFRVSKILCENIYFSNEIPLFILMEWVLGDCWRENPLCRSCKFPLERAKTTSPTKTGRLTIVKSAKNSNSFQYVIAKDTVPECVQISFNEPGTNISDWVVVQSGASSLAKHGGAYFSAVYGSIQDPIAGPGLFDIQVP